MMKDPHYQREAKKYQHPIPSREFILSLIRKKQLSFRQLSLMLNIEQSQSKPLKKRLSAMIRDKELSLSKNGVYRKFSYRGLHKGIVIAHPKGFGFVKLSKGGRDLRLSSHQMQLCFHGDEVRVRLLNDKFDAQIVDVLTLQTNLVGRLAQTPTGMQAIIDDKYVSHQVQIDTPIHYQHNDIVLLDIIKNPTANTLAIGRITSKLGTFGDIDLETKSALLRFDIPHIFSDEVIKEVDFIPDEVSPKDLTQRVDFSRDSFITIDGEDSKDFDDAVYVVATDNGYELKIAIADVGHYVSPDTALDECAKHRGNSVYFPRFVVPMLPEKLSNNLCSLNEKVTRLALVCSMRINAIGEVTSYQFDTGYICSHQRLTYTQVNQYFAGDIKTLGSTKVQQNIDALLEVYKLLKMNRQKLGLIEFERIESKIVFNDSGKIAKISPYQRGISEKIIEECMLVANKSAGDFLTNHQAQFLYRSHPKPDKEKLLTTRMFLKTFGLDLGGGDNPTAKDFANVLQTSKHKPEHNVIKTLMLRSMSQAVYSPDIPYHFGLAFENYTHFTSPIRRYADLLTHRAIKHILNKSNYHIAQLGEVAKHISMTERRAEEAARDSERWLKCEYMLTKVGRKFSGTISAVLGFGLFVELNDLLVDGLVKIESLPGYFIYDATTISLYLKNGTKSYTLGDQVQVVIASVNLERREINLVMSA